MGCRDQILSCGGNAITLHWWRSRRCCWTGKLMLTLLYCFCCVMCLAVQSHIHFPAPLPVTYSQGFFGHALPRLIFIDLFYCCCAMLWHLFLVFAAGFSSCLVFYLWILLDMCKQVVLEGDGSVREYLDLVIDEALPVKTIKFSVNNSYLYVMTPNKVGHLQVIFMRGLCLLELMTQNNVDDTETMTNYEVSSRSLTRPSRAEVRPEPTRLLRCHLCWFSTAQYHSPSGGR